MGKKVIKAARLGGEVQTIELEGDATVGDVTKKMGDITNCEVRRNNEPAQPKDPVEDGDVLTYVPAIQGGQK